MLENIGLEGGGPRAYAGEEPMEGVVAPNWRHQAEIQYPYNCIPQTFYQSCTTEGDIPIEDNYDFLTSASLCEVTPTEGMLD